MQQLASVLTEILSLVSIISFTVDKWRRIGWNENEYYPFVSDFARRTGRCDLNNFQAMIFIYLWTYNDSFTLVSHNRHLHTRIRSCMYEQNEALAAHLTHCPWPPQGSPSRLTCVVELLMTASGPSPLPLPLPPHPNLPPSWVALEEKRKEGLICERGGLWHSHSHRTPACSLFTVFKSDVRIKGLG